jgi:hypothetical protein
MKIFIPTFNRSEKLRRSLAGYYHTIESKKFDISILDASDLSHGKKNLLTCQNFSFNHHSLTGKSFYERILPLLADLDPDEIIAILPDEDFFDPEFLITAMTFLRLNPEYSAYVGRYMTFLKPAINMHRVDGSRDCVIDLDINLSRSSDRFSVLLSALSLGCSPLFWGVRRAGVFFQSITLQSKLKYGSCAELLDQALLCQLGLIKFVPDLMCLRDETKIAYSIPNDHQGKDSYIDRSDIQSMNEILSNFCCESGIALGQLAEIYHLHRNTRDKTLADEAHFIYRKKYRNYSDTEGKMLSLASNLEQVVRIYREVMNGISAISYLNRRYGENFVKLILKKIKVNS